MSQKHSPSKSSWQDLFVSKFRQFKYSQFEASKLVETGLNFDIEKVMATNPAMDLKADLKTYRSWIKEFENAPRYEILRGIVDGLEAGTNSRRELFERIVLFCQMISRHYNNRQLLLPDDPVQIISDPLVLINAHEMRCGHVSRVTCDLFDAADFETRLLQLGGHIACEVKLDGNWACVDNDLLGGGNYVTDPNGDVLSFVDLSYQPDRLDRLPSLWEKAIFNEPQIPNVLGPFPYASYFYFSINAYGDSHAATLTKTGNRSEYSTQNDYGWDQLDVKPIRRVNYTSQTLRYTNGACDLSDIQTHENQVDLVWWAKSGDHHADLDHYEFHFSAQSRGWNFNLYKGKPEYQKYWTGPVEHWDEGTYLKIYEAPKPDHVIVSDSPTVSIDRSVLKTYPYCTCSVIDKRSLEIGRTIHANSPEYYLAGLSENEIS